MPSYGFKRKRTYVPRNSRFKRRRFGRMARRGRRTGGRTTSYTSQASRASTFGFRSRRIRPRRYRQMLWRDSAMKTHYRSYLAQSDTFLTSGLTTQCRVFYYPTIEFGARFWTAAGGAVGVDTAVAVPTFQDDIILRGGVISLTIGNDNQGSLTDIRVRLWLIVSDQTPGIGATVPPNGSGGTATNFSRDWDPSLVADSHKEFAKRIVLQREAFVQNGETLVVRHRLRTQKIDQEDYLDDNNKLFWVVAVSPNVGVANDFTCTASYNLSFSGDAV